MRKLQRSCGFDVSERYRKLADVWQRVGLTEEASWTRAAREWVDSGQGQPPPVRVSGAKRRESERAE